MQNSNLSNEHLFFSAANNRPTFLEEEELLTDTSDILNLVDIPNRKFLSIAEANRWQINLTSKYYSAENHFSIPQKTTYDGLRKFYDYYPFPEMIDYYHPNYKHKSDLIERIKAHYKIISSKMGHEVIPMSAYLNSFAYGIATSGREDLAIALFEFNIELYPNNPVVYNNLGNYYETKGNVTEALKVYKKSIKLKSDEWILKLIERLEGEKD